MKECFLEAARLPPEWDILGRDNYAIKRDFLTLLEKSNPCDQRYYVFRDSEGNVDSILMTFRAKKCNIVMFTPLDFRVDVTFVHLPVSVTRPGYVMGERTRNEVEEFLLSLQGCIIVLNVRDGLAIKHYATACTCSQLLLRLRWNSFADYIGSMRSHYRHRINKALKKRPHLEFHLLEDNECFNEKLYSFYEDVHANSRIKIEKLGIGFFKAPVSRIICCKIRHADAGFIQLIENGRELIFEFIGVDYSLNAEYDLYLNLLLYMVEYGIAGGFQVIELGQTAEETKLRIGGEFSKLQALLHHSNPLLNLFLNLVKNRISYKQPAEVFNIFKDGG